jgi:hypothetical protein
MIMISLVFLSYPLAHRGLVIVIVLLRRRGLRRMRLRGEMTRRRRGGGEEEEEEEEEEVEEVEEEVVFGFRLVASNACRSFLNSNCFCCCFFNVSCASTHVFRCCLL